MSFYQQNDEQLKVDLGKGMSITLILRGETLDIAALRLLWHNQKQVMRDQGRIAQFEKDLEKEELSDEEYDSINGRIKALEGKADGLSVLVDQAYGCLKSPGWTDYFESKDAEQRGVVVPFSKQAIESMGPGALLKITRALASHLGLNELAEDAEPGEAKGTSHERLQLAGAIPSNTQIGIPNSVSTEL